MTTLHLSPVNGGPFNCRPANTIQLENERILCNDIIFQGEFNPHNTRLWVVGNEFGALGSVWASHEQDALDILCDAMLLAGLEIDEPTTEEDDEDVTRLGNAGVPHDLTNAWIQLVEFVPSRDWQLLCRFAEARGACNDNLDK